MTRLDDAHAALTAQPDDDALRLRFYERIADSELFLLLMEDADPASQDSVQPRVFDLADGPVVLAFDREDRLSAFTGAVSAFAALPGRQVAAALSGQGIGIGLNLGVAPSSFLLPPEAVDWLAATLAQGPVAHEAVPVAFGQPKGLPDSLVAGLDAKLAQAAGLAVAALLAGVDYADGRRGHILCFVGAVPGAEPALARIAGEALTFSGIEAGEIDVAFRAANDPVLAALARVALRFDLPLPALPERIDAAPPGSDPARPPILR